MAKFTQKQKHAIILSTDFIILAGLALVVKATWDQAAYEDFLSHRLYLAYPTIAGTIFSLLVLPLLPKPNEEKSPAIAPTKAQAWGMLLTTWGIDYGIVVALCIYLNRHLVYDNGKLCPFAAGLTLHLMLMASVAKDEVVSRLLFRPFLARKKLNVWPYNFQFCWNMITRFMTFMPLGMIGFIGLGLCDFEDISINPMQSTLRIWAEAVGMAFITDLFGMTVLHKWMHDNAYFLHKWHHAGKNDMIITHAYSFDLLDLIFEFGGGVPQVCFIKWCLGLHSQVHVLSFYVALYAAVNAHSLNPYSVYFFNPIMDYVARNNIGHSLHHTVQNDYYTGFPFKHFLSAEARRQDIDRYNKAMTTEYPRDV